MVVPSCTIPTVLITISILEKLNWSVSALGTVITVDLLPQLSKISATLCSVYMYAVYQLIEILDSCKICLRNPDADLVQQWNSFSPTLHSSEGI